MTAALSTADALDLIPDPGEVHAQIRAAARHARLLRRQLRLSLAAKAERESANPLAVNAVEAAEGVSGAR